MSEHDETEPGLRRRGSGHMSSSTDIHAHAEEGAFEDHRAAWLGPAMGSALLTVLYTLYVVPVFFGILSTSA